MPLSLHAAIVPSWLQILGSVRHLVDKAEIHCNEHGVAAADLLGVRLIDDMYPLAFQFKSCWVHTERAIAAVRSGQFTRDPSDLPTSFAAIAAGIDQAIGALAAVDAAELEQYIGREVAFAIEGQFAMRFTAENFLLGFSQPNFYFHATTAYDILRSRGLSIGKRDFIGAMPLKH